MTCITAAWIVIILILFLCVGLLDLKIMVYTVLSIAGVFILVSIITGVFYMMGFPIE